MGKQIHKLSNINKENLTATCEKCGFVKTYKKKDGTVRCSLGHRAHKVLSQSVKTLYLIKADNGLTKIGVTNNFIKRLSTLTYNSPCKLNVLKEFIIEFPFKKERELHDMFSHKRMHGEWFDLNETELKWIENYLNPIS